MSTPSITSALWTSVAITSVTVPNQYHPSSTGTLPTIAYVPRPPGGGSWSPIIGIVTAIIGNILISLALNTQRYAHIRLSQEREEQEEKQRNHSKARTNGGGGGGGGYSNSDQAQKADVRAKKNANAKFLPDGDNAGGLDGAREEASETDPLIRRDDGRGDNSGSDTSTVKDHDNEGSTEQKSYLKSPWWWLGITLMVVGESGNFLAYGFAPASIVSPLGVVALVSNCLIAPLMLHEQFRARDGLGVVIAIAGCVTVVLSASGSNPKLDADQIWELITTWEFETYFGITLFLIIVLMAASNKYGERSILIDLGLVALFGGYTALSTKGVASLLSNKIWRVVTFPITYLLVAILVSTAVLQIKYVNRALYRFDSTRVIPVQFVLFTLSVIVGSAILYRDFERKTAEDAGKFIGGCALTFLGVWCITSNRPSGGESDEEEGSEEDEDGINLVDEEGQLPQIREEVVEDGGLRPPQQQRLYSSQSDAPIFKFTTEDGQESPIKDSGYLDTNPWAEATASTAKPPFHGETGELPAPPSSRRNFPKPPPIHATTSEPVLPTNARAPRVELDSSPTRTRKDSNYRPRTPENQTTPTLDPGSASVPRFGSVSRHSIVSIIPNPGPLTNPLSNSLSAIVADSLRRGVDAPSRESMGMKRHRSLRVRRSRNKMLGQRLYSEADVGDRSGVDGGRRRSLSLGLGGGGGRRRASEQLEHGGENEGLGDRARRTIGALGDYFGLGKKEQREGEQRGDGGMV